MAARGPRGDSVGQRRLDDDAERLVFERVSAALPESTKVFPNVRWVDQPRPGGPARDGETDILIVDPDRGLLAIEVKGGPVGRDGFGRWYVGTRHLEESPFKQVEVGKRAIARKIAADSRWRGEPPRMVHAVAFPATDSASLGRGGPASLGPDAPIEIVVDRADLIDPVSAATAIARVFGFWSGDGLVTGRSASTRSQSSVTSSNQLSKCAPCCPATFEKGS